MSGKTPPDLQKLKDERENLRKRVRGADYPPPRGLDRHAAKLERRIESAEEQRRKDLAAMHILRKEIAIPDDAWRARISAVSQGRTDSSADLTRVERRILLRELSEVHEPRDRPDLRDTQVADTKDALVRKVRALLGDACRGDAYADAIARSRFAVERWEWLEYPELLKLVQMLVIDQRRRMNRITKTEDAS